MREHIVIRIRWKGLLAVTLAVAVGLAVAEGVVRGLVALRVVAGETRLSLEGVEPVLVHDDVLGWRNAERTDVAIGEPKVPVRFNAFGFRGRDVPETKKPGAFRVLLLGDSQGFGWGVREESTIAAVLEAGLTRDLGGRTPVEVLNAAVTGYGTDQELLLFRRWGRRLTPDVVLVVYYENDGPNVCSSVQYAVAKPFFEVAPERLVLHNVPVPRAVGTDRLRPLMRPRPTLEHFALYRLLLSRVQASPTAARWFNALGLVSVDYPWTYSNPYESCDAKVVRLLQELRGEAAVGGARLLVLYVRSFVGADRTTTPSETPAEWLGAGFPVLNLREEFARLGVGPDEALLPEHYHLSARGHAIAADLVRRFLVGSGWTRSN
jgi:hypothetical protein